jgi:NAD(P)H-nitrite reductase large subunit
MRSNAVVKDDEIIVCRCEEVLRKEILHAMEKGARDLDAVKRMTRAGMGMCQGRTCSELIRTMLNDTLHISKDKLPSATTRPPVRLVPSQAFLEAKERQYKE